MNKKETKAKTATVDKTSEADHAVYKYDLGDVLEDRISGYKGAVISRHEWLNGCKRYTIQAKKLDSNGKPIDSYAIDEGDAILVEEGDIAKARDTGVRIAGGKKPGGPYPATPQFRR